ncbi:hypothetical protein K8R14_02605 [bacterium]|nr:hypothetical protein [bacterium]
MKNKFFIALFLFILAFTNSLPVFAESENERLKRVCSKAKIKIANLIEKAYVAEKDARFCHAAEYLSNALSLWHAMHDCPNIPNDSRYYERKRELEKKWQDVQIPCLASRGELPDLTKLTNSLKCISKCNEEYRRCKSKCLGSYACEKDCKKNWDSCLKRCEQ